MCTLAVIFLSMIQISSTAQLWINRSIDALVNDSYRNNKVALRRMNDAKIGIALDCRKCQSAFSYYEEYLVFCSISSIKICGDIRLIMKNDANINLNTNHIYSLPLDMAAIVLKDLNLFSAMHG